MSVAYLVASGEYSDYGVHFVTLDKALAEQYCDAKNVDSYLEYRVQERTLLRGDLGSQITVYNVNVTVWDPARGGTTVEVHGDEEKWFPFETTSALAEISHEPRAAKRGGSGTVEGDWEIFFSVRGTSKDVVNGYVEAMTSHILSQFSEEVDRLTRAV